MALIGGRSPVVGQDNYTLREQLFELRRLVSELLKPAPYCDLHNVESFLLEVSAGAVPVTFTERACSQDITTTDMSALTVMTPGLYYATASIASDAQSTGYTLRIAIQKSTPLVPTWTDHAVNRDCKGSTINTPNGVKLVSLIAIPTANTKLRLTVAAEDQDVTISSGAAGNWFRLYRVGPAPANPIAF